jgi:hypothetical protein
MAKSIYEILDDLQTETSVPEVKDNDNKVLRVSFGTVKHTIPRELFPTSEQFESEKELLAWAQEKGITHSVLQKGIQKFLIEVRATFKGMKKDEEWNEDKGQEAVNNSKWEVMERPKGKKSDEQIAEEFLASLSEKDRKAFLAKMAK